MITIATLRAAGLTEAQVLRVIEIEQRERIEQKREAAKVRARNYRARHASERDVTLLRRDARDARDATTYKDTSLLPSLEKKERKKERKKVHALSAQWVLTEADRNFAATRNWPQARIDSEEQRFRDYWLANGKAKADWAATWRNWVTSPIQNGGGQFGSSHVRSSRQQAGGLTEAIAKVRSRLGADADRPPDVLIPQDRLPKPRGVHSDIGRDLGGLPTGDRGLRDRSEDRPAASLQVAPDASGSGGGMRGRDRVANEDSPELRLVAGTEIAASSIQRRG
jgi:hypothetical protein